MKKITPLASKCRLASPHDVVLNSECAFTFHNPYTTPSGIVVNLSTFVGTIDELALAQDGEEALFVRIVKKRVPKPELAEDKEEVTKLALGMEGGFNDAKFDTESKYSVVLLQKKNGTVSVVEELAFDDKNKNDFPMNVTSSVESIIHHAGVAVQQDLKAFELEEEKVVSKYIATIEVVDNGISISPNPADWKCEKSGDTENLWLNLSDGFIGGGRKNWDGSGGSNGALDHFLETGEKYPLVVKLGTITQDIDTADCYSYAKDEDGPVLIPNLAELLQKRGINVAGMQKTAKSTAELEVELNATYAFDAITEAGATLVPVSGPGLQGLQNLGNSCYINSVVQMLFSGTVPELSSRYGTQPNGSITQHSLLKVSPTNAASDLLCQTTKLACALTSGVFVAPEPPGEVTDDLSPSNDPKYRIPPRMFKHIIGKDHVDFCTGQQQDAAHFLQYLLEKIDRAELGNKLINKADADTAIPTTSGLFSYKTTSRLMCSKDGKLKYKENQPETIWSLSVPMDKAEAPVRASASSEAEPEEKRQKGSDEVPTVTLKACIEHWSAPRGIDGMRWSHLDNGVSTATEETRFSNFPRYLIAQIQRYELGPDWTPRKLEVNIDVPDELDLSSLRSTGPQDGEDILPDDDNNDEKNETSESQPQINVDEGSVAQLMDMGFGMNGCIRALHAVGGSNVELAMNWIFEHNGDPDFNDPLPSAGETGSGSAPAGAGVDEGVVASLVENLGCFTADQVRAAVKECGGDSARAADWLFSHMDDLNGAIAQLQSNASGPSEGISPPTPPSHLEDGEGKYRLTGLVSHIGKNTGSGHYVAHLKKDGKWVIFNDEKVALSENPPTQHAYLYLFQRIDSIGSPNSSY